MSTELRHDPDRVVAQVLINAGLGTDPALWADTSASDGGAWPVRNGGEGDRPDEVITVYEGTPQTDARTMPDGANVNHYGITVRVRGQTKAAARQKAADVAQYLNESLYDLKLTLDGTEYSVPSAWARAVRRLGTIETGRSSLWVYTVDCLIVILAYPTGR